MIGFAPMVSSLWGWRDNYFSTLLDCRISPAMFGCLLHFCICLRPRTLRPVLPTPILLGWITFRSASSSHKRRFKFATHPHLGNACRVLLKYVSQKKKKRQDSRGKYWKPSKVKEGNRTLTNSLEGCCSTIKLLSQEENTDPWQSAFSCCGFEYMRSP